MECGILTKEEFLEEIKQFLVVSDKIGDLWKVESIHEELFITKKFSQKLEFVRQKTDGCGLSRGEEDVVDDDEDSVDDVDSAGSEVFICDYHVVYSPSYNVPVLYFNIYTQSGMLLDLDSVWRSVGPPHQHRLTSDRWTFISQQEHPFLNGPFYQLHPCHTADLMKATPATPAPGGYLLRWLSSVGPAVNLNIPLQYATLLNSSTPNST